MKTKQEKRGIKLKTTLEISKSEYFGFGFVFYNPTTNKKDILKLSESFDPIYKQENEWKIP